MLSECRDALQAVREELKPDQVLDPPQSALSSGVATGSLCHSLSLQGVCRCDHLISNTDLWAPSGLGLCSHGLLFIVVMPWFQPLVSRSTLGVWCSLFLIVVPFRLLD